MERHLNGQDPRNFDHFHLAGRRGGRDGGGDRGNPFGGNPFGGNPFGLGGPGGPGGPFRRFPWDLFGGGPRARKGDIRAAILALLAEQPRNGYQLMQEIEERSGGTWRPSPGSVYPALQQVEDENLVTAEAAGAGKVFKLTAQGRAYVEERADELKAPWAARGGADLREEIHEIREQFGQLMAAFGQVARSGDAKQLAAAKKIVSDARRALYRLLAEEGEGAD
jgi:DNA-binding PadR family transcriptional regulator